MCWRVWPVRCWPSRPAAAAQGERGRPRPLWMGRCPYAAWPRWTRSSRPSAVRSRSSPSTTTHPIVLGYSGLNVRSTWLLRVVSTLSLWRSVRPFPITLAPCRLPRLSRMWPPRRMPSRSPSTRCRGRGRSSPMTTAVLFSYGPILTLIPSPPSKEPTPGRRRPPGCSRTPRTWRTCSP